MITETLRTFSILSKGTDGCHILVSRIACAQTAHFEYNRIGGCGIRFSSHHQEMDEVWMSELQHFQPTNWANDPFQLIRTMLRPDPDFLIILDKDK
jgi:hypothetical protein